MMRSRRGRILILTILLLLLAGCNRQAEGPFQPVGSGENATSVSSVASSTPDPALAATEDTAVVTDELLPTNEIFTPETLIPTLDTSVITDPTATTEPGAIVIFTLVATETFTPEGAVGMVTEAATIDPLATSEFITPGSSNDLMQAATATPEPGSTSELAATPTNMPEVDGTDTSATDETVEVNEECIYVVKRGDSLFQIAMRNDTTITALRAANKSIQGTDVILPGDELFIPDCDVTPTPTVTRTPLPEGGQTHTVKSGESLFIIARQYGVTIDEIVEANNLANPDRLFIGQVLIIPQD